MSGDPRSPGLPPGPGSAPGSAPLLAPAQAAILLDQVIYEQVLECVDIDALHRLEQSLTMIVADFEGDADRAGDVAKAIIDRALLRIPDDVRSYLHALAGPPFDDCELCAEEAGDDTRPRERPPKPKPSTRLKS